jgi:hypothetical protein
MPSFLTRLFGPSPAVRGNRAKRILAPPNTQTPNGSLTSGGGGQADSFDPQTQDPFQQADQEVHLSSASIVPVLY